MSSTSTKIRRHRIRQGRRSEGEVSQDEERRRDDDQLTSSRDFSTTERSGESLPRKWTSGKLKEELSSFIAEFSYLTDTSTKTPNTEATSHAQSNIKTRQPLQVFAARRVDTGTPFDSSNLRVVRRKVVDWEDQKNNVIAYNATQDTDCCEEPQRVKTGRIIKHGRLKGPPRVRVRKSRSMRRSTSRDFTCPRRSRSTKIVRRRFSNFRASKSRSRCRQKVRRSRSHSGRRVRNPLRRRRTRSRSCSRSSVKDMPFRFRSSTKECRGTRSREIVVKRKKPAVVFKKIEPCEEPTLVTLFPKPIPSKCIRDPELPCKCAQCRRKLKSLARLYKDPNYDPCASPCIPRYPVCAPCPPICAPCPPTCAPCPPTCAPCPPTCAPCPPICAPYPPICAPYPPKCQMLPRACSPCSPNWYYNQGAVCNRPFVNQCYTNNCCQPLTTNSCKSVYFKFGSMGQSLNSCITQYFHSILDKTACC